MCLEGGKIHPGEQSGDFAAVVWFNDRFPLKSLSDNGNLRIANRDQSICSYECDKSTARAPGGQSV